MSKYDEVLVSGAADKNDRLDDLYDEMERDL